jgi:hypothetical protein
MLGIATPTIIATMKYHHTRRDRPDKPLVRKSVCPYFLAFTAHR